jgi:hypothetical protein
MENSGAKVADSGDGPMTGKDKTVRDRYRRQRCDAGSGAGVQAMTRFGRYRSG